MDPLRARMRSMVRPCTAKTRRKQLTIRFQLPRRGFEELMAPFGEGDAVGLTRGADGRLQPTKSTLRLMRFNYTLKKGSFSDKLFQLQNFQQYAAPSARARASKGPPKPPHPHKRGLGCAKLHLSGADGRRGRLATVLSMVCGNVIIEYTEPRKLRAMPTLRLRFFVLSMDKDGNIVWPTNFPDQTRACLRKQARTLLSKMMDDPAYPVDPRFSAALQSASDSYLVTERLAAPAIALALPHPPTTA